MVLIQQEDALNYLIDELAKVPSLGFRRARDRQPHGSDIWIDLVAGKFWQESRALGVLAMAIDDKEPYVAPFYDAAWELCRRGVLRPGAAVAAGQTHTSHITSQPPSAPFFGDGFSLTAWGREWVKKSKSERQSMPADAGRLTQVLDQFRSRFGDGYAQRSAEAVSDWHAGNYLSACVMVGAAAESILLAAAIAKVGDEAKVLAIYKSARGRDQTIKQIRDGTDKVLGDRFGLALGILSYWRDEAAHGTASNIGEVDAHEALSRLLGLARLTNDNWVKLTT